MELTRWTSADTANQAPKATSPISDSWRTTSKTLSIPPNWLSLPRSPGSLPAADLCFASRAAHVRNYSPTIFFFLLGSVRTQQRCVRVAAARATVGVPRIIAIAVFNGFGVHAFDDLPVVRFAVNERDKGLLTPQYSFALAQNFRPERDYQANIRAIRQTLRVLVGQNDDVSYADRFAAVFKTAGKDVPVTVLPGIDHISLTLDPVAVQAAIAAVESMDHEKPNQT